MDEGADDEASGDVVAPIGVDAVRAIAVEDRELVVVGTIRRLAPKHRPDVPLQWNTDVTNGERAFEKRCGVVAERILEAERYEKLPHLEVGPGRPPVIDIDVGGDGLDGGVIDG